MGLLINRMCFWIRIQRIRSKRRRCRFQRSHRNLRRMYLIKIKSRIRLIINHQIIIRSQRIISRSHWHEKKRSLRLRNRLHRLLNDRKSHRWCLSNLRLNLGRRSLFRLIKQTHQRSIKINRCHQKSSLNGNRNERLSLISLLRRISQRSLIKQS